MIVNTIRSQQPGIITQLRVLLLSTLVIAGGCKPAKHVSLSEEGNPTALRNALGESLSGTRSLFLPPGLLAPMSKDQSLRLPSPEESAEAISDTSAFLTLNRRYRFDRVFLLPGSSCSSLRDHLLHSAAWVLYRVLPEGYLFAPAAKTAWHPPDAAEATRLHPDESERSLWLIGIAENLIAIGYPEEAMNLLKLSTCSKDHESRRLSVLASLEASCGHWNKALDYSDESLRLDRNNRNAMVIHIRSLAETGHADEALSKARNYAAAIPDAETLFLLARVANVSGDHAVEISALRRLVAVASREKQPAGASLLYLGQALARDGQRGEALRILEEAEAAPELTQDQRKVIRELREHLAPEKG